MQSILRVCHQERLRFSNDLGKKDCLIILFRLKINILCVISIDKYNILWYDKIQEI
nr:MAG TPA: hypothetical protein [Caudoviricetes sp.]